MVRDLFRASVLLGNIPCSLPLGQFRNLHSRSPVEAPSPSSQVTGSLLPLRQSIIVTKQLPVHSLPALSFRMHTTYLFLEKFLKEMKTQRMDG